MSFTDPNKISSLALVDCNNFYVSCERVFQPRYAHTPVIVLSNNDGCAIARSNESKALGIQMGDPLHQIQGLVKHHGVKVFSSNYALYGDMSQRVMHILNHFSPAVEYYSIDEAFMDLQTTQAHELVQTVKQWSGIPVSVGIGPSKTLAKLANHIAKRNPCFHSVFDLSDLATQQHWLPQIAVGDLWGIGSRWQKKLAQINIHNAWQLRQADPQIIRKRFNIIVATMVDELNGKPQFGLELETTPKQRICVSRSFAKKLSKFEELYSALANHVTRAGEKLRKQGSLVQALTVFLHTNPYSIQDQQYANSYTLALPMASQDTRVLLKTAKQALHKIFRPHYQYKKVGVILLDLIDKNHLQADLFSPYNELQATQLMQVLDSINQKQGRDTLHFACATQKQHWQMRAELRSPAYTTQWGALPIAKS